MKIHHKSKRPITPLPQIVEFVDKLYNTPDDELHQALGQIDTWRWPRSDLNAWTKVLNKFDAILEEVIRDYDIDKLQVNVLTPVTKKTVCEILRFERLLLENSTNRKIFNSYDRLNSLMFTSDLDVLLLTLNLLLRPAQQYSAQPAVIHALSLSTPRLTSLAKRWPNLREYDLNLAELVSEKGKAQVEALPNEAREVHFTFYKQDAPAAPAGKEREKSSEATEPLQQTPTRKPSGSGSAVAPPTNAASASGAVTIRIDSKTIESKEPMDILADTIEAYNVPESEKFELLTRIRTARALVPAYAAERERLVTIRLLATAVYGHTHSESQAQSSIFLYEPDVIVHIAELLQLDRGVDVQIQTAAVAALDALGRYRNKIQDVLTAVNAGVNHGTLMALLRKTVADVAQPSSTLPQPFVEALLSFVTYIATHASGGNMVVGAGLVPLLIQVIENRLPNRLYVVSKTMQLLDNVLYGFNNAFQLFCNGRGVDILVDRIEYEVDLDLQQCGDDQTPQEVAISYGKLSVARAAVLKHTLRSMLRMMQSSGATEGLRGLLDSSLLKSVKKIMETRSIFGPSVLPIAINIMATFVHNEPTCLAVIQEAGLPEAFYRVVEAGLEPVIEVIQAVPNAIGALCLNQAGQDQLTARPNIIPGLFSIFTSERHQRVLQDKENAVLIGTAVEELIRHHPSLKQSVLDSIKSTMDTICQIASEYVPAESDRHWYLLSSTSSAPSISSDSAPAADVVMEPVETHQSQVTPATPPSGGASDEASMTRDDPLSPRSHDNVIVSYIDVVGKFLEGFFQHLPHCRDFMADQGALERLGKLTALPCLPYDFATSVASDSLVQVFRTMSDTSPGETVTFMTNLIHEALADTREFWASMQEQSQWLPMIDISADELERSNAHLRKLITLHIRTSLLSDIFSAAGYSHGRSSVSLLQSLVGQSANDILPELGALHRACVWENIVLKAGLTSLKVDTPLASDINADSPTPSTVTPSATVDADPASASMTNGVVAEPSSSNDVQPGTVESAKDSPRVLNARIFKHLASQIPTSLAPFFQSVVRLFQNRRSTDIVQRQKVREVASVFADVMGKHLEQKTFNDNLSLLAYYTVMLGLSTILLVDERTSQKTLYTVLLTTFNRVGGMDSIVGLCRTFINTIETVTQVAEDVRSEAAKQELVHAYGGLKVALHLLHPIVSVKPLFESPQTALMMTSERRDSDSDFFDPHNFMVRMRVAVVPLLRDIWQAPWLVSAPLGVCKSVVQIAMEILNVEGEEVKETPLAGPPLTAGGFSITRAPGPDETRIRQLVDMGFPRSAAERALVRTRNNVSAATELLLAHPFPFPPDPEPNDPAPAAEPTTDEAAMQEEQEADADGEHASTSSSSATNEEVEPAPAPVAPKVKSAEEWLSELNAARDPIKDGLGAQALRIVDEHPSLVFDLQKIFVGSNNGYREQAARQLVDDVKAFSPAAYDVQEQPLAVRCRLLALVLSEPQSPLSQMSDSDSKSLVDVLLALLLSNPSNAEGHPTIPKWLAAHLLVTEALLVADQDCPTIELPKENEPVPQDSFTITRHYQEARTIVFDFCLRLLAVPSLPKDELLSALRLFVFLTEDHEMAKEFVRRDGVGLVFQYMKISAGTASAAGIQSHVAIILRHIAEDRHTLQHVMRQEIRRYLAHPRNRLVDAGSFVVGCNALALRHPESFIQVTQDICQLSNPYSSIRNISLKSETKREGSGSHGGDADTRGSQMQIDEPSPSHQQSPSETLETLVHFILTELIQSIRSENISEPDQLKPRGVDNAGATVAAPTTSLAADAQKQTPSQDHADHEYPCFLMQCLTELLFSYESCKVALLSFSPKKRVQAPAKEVGLRHRTAALQLLLSDVMSFGTINPQPPADARKRIMLCNWAMSVVVALCVDTSFTQDIKDVSTELVSVRKFVLEAISRQLKDLPSSENPETRYSRLLALADLTYRLLTVRFNANPRKANEEAPTHIAKVMLEKNFVATLTNALAEVDLNYPNIRGVVTAVLRPLDFLSKIAIKMSRISDKSKDAVEEKVEETDSDISEEDEDTDEQEGDESTDLYRNSSLGLFGGEMEDVNYGPDDDMDEDGEEDEDDVEMDFGDETGSDDTSNTDEDAEDDLEDDLEGETGESEEEGWQDGEEEEEEDLVENDGARIDDDEGEEDEEDEGEEVMWQDIAVGDDMPDGAAEEPDEDEETGVPIMHMDLEDQVDAASEADEFGDLDVADQGPVPGNIFELATGFANAIGEGALNAGPRVGQPMFWTGTMRSGRRRGPVDDDWEIFGRPRNGNAASPEAVTHPLLVDPTSALARSQGSTSRNARRYQRGLANGGDPHDLIHALEDVMGGGALQFFQHIVSHGRGAGGETIRIDVPPGALVPIQRHGRGTISASIRLERAPRPGEGRSDARILEPLLTVQRWLEEVKMLHGRHEQGRLSKLNNHVILALMPAAVEALKRAKAAEAEAAKKREEQARAEEATAKEKEQAEEKARLEEIARQSTTASDQPASTSNDAANQAPETADADTEMIDVSGDDAPDIPSTIPPVTDSAPAGPEIIPSEETGQEQVAESSTSNTAERVTVMIHGSPVDITDTGIDPTFLEALPDDMREEVLNQHVRDQRAARVERPPDSQISAEFLDALPPELRAEILQQESIERARQRVEAASQQGTGAPAELDPASFLASLDPGLRQVVLMDSDDVFIQSLPSHLLAEAGIHRENARNIRNQPAAHPVNPPSSTSQQAPKPSTPRDAIQLLDKPSITILVRLLFFPHTLRKNLLFKVLVNLCENSKTRSDLFNLLLNILQDGSGDLASIDRSFAQMSFRSTKQSNQQTPKSVGKQKVPSDYFGTLTLPQGQNEIVPELIVQRCLEALTYIVSSNELSSLFFLTEHELPLGLRRHVSKKGKGKEKHVPQTHYPVVLLLSLLDRPSILKTPSIVESVVTLLATVTRPLASLKSSSRDKTESTGSATTPDQQPGPPANAAQSSANAPPSTGEATQVQTEPSRPETASADKVLLTKPPVIPHTVMRLIVNILTAGECSGRTFSQSLALIQHLSFVPEARDVIANELRSRAQDFGHGLHAALDELATALRESQSDVLASAIASKFSPASSDQAKLLRVLKTIDYMFSPRSTTSPAAAISEADIEKVQEIYESFRFAPLWRRLGDCLAIIEERQEMEHIATVLLPLIESLMVVCKYVGTKSGGAARLLRASASPRSPTTPRESMEDLFVTFTDAHRKVLNLMVRNNPSLMSGSFSLLVHNPRVLDFDNKRNYFNQQLHRRPHSREHHGTLQLNVRRQRVFEDSFQYLQRKTGDQIKYGKLSIRFYDEEGVDAGGVTREWFQILARQMFDPNYALFQPCAADRLTYQPNKASWVNPEHLSFFKFVGRVIGKAIYDGRLLDAYFARSLYRQLLGKPVDYKDVEWVDPEYYNSLCWILENDPSALELTFSVEADEFGVTKIVDLKENGRSTPVTQENKREFVQLSAQYRLYSSIKDQIEALLNGFYEIIPKDLITIFNEQELELLISGTPDIDVDEWRAATDYNGYSSSDPVIVWFWRALKSFNREERAKVLSFATGTSRVPLGGFTELQGVQGVQKFSIHRAYGDTDRLPQAHTCFNQIDLPQYSSYEMLRQQLLLAINEGGEGFGFA
ncbi:hypothetical protein WOLCODRAFT_75349 [Wolfiporia cocos MD-104 SS10]|uniref:HECT-type E3 ubiquitin transferase n=1 Tax=Wolfiporia cocos (strain MD-104) TaxID=742152 RepID=A0A2H3JUD9_WOLCO|nr:hypothetical protein WOLCODRAFT_75349 [Wolfiporia cocos MD-104 SS10]